jgi:molecular chaperone GrpE
MQNKQEDQEELEKKNQEQAEEFEDESVENDAEMQDDELVMSKEDEYLSGWKRCQADFENFKKRQAESQKDLIRYSMQNIVMQILPVIDNFQASTAHIPEDQKNNPWVTGIMYIQKQLEQILVDNGVAEIEVRQGDNFDPARHEAVEDKECVGCKSKDYKFKNKIKKVMTKGYMIGERVIRAARVTVE